MSRGPSESKFDLNKNIVVHCVAETVLTGRRSYQLTCEASLEIRQYLPQPVHEPAPRRIQALVVCRSTLFANNFTVYDDSASPLRCSVKPTSFSFYVLKNTFRVSREICIVVTRVCVFVCMSVRGCVPTLLHEPGCNLEEW